MRLDLKKKYNKESSRDMAEIEEIINPEYIKSCGAQPVLKFLD